MSNPRPKITEQDVRVQVLGLLHRFEELGGPIPAIDAISGLVGAAAIRAVTAGLTEKKFKRLAEYAYRSARVALQIEAAKAKRLVVIESEVRQ